MLKTVKTVGTEKNILGHIQYTINRLNSIVETYEEDLTSLELLSDLIINQLENDLREFKDMKKNINKKQGH